MKTKGLKVISATQTKVLQIVLNTLSPSPPLRQTFMLGDGGENEDML